MFAVRGSGAADPRERSVVPRGDAAQRSEPAGEGWRDRAACLREDPELFFPVGVAGSALRQIECAKDVCRRCPVREQCLRWALDNGQDSGVWGGTSEDERRAMKRRAARQGLRAGS
ncbi:WhiB family transcriptional regulator [Kitasatospora sp. NA04385]|nr:WhiB family transcriptional regulator [Kitasatospora sp. NA04385]